MNRYEARLARLERFHPATPPEPVSKPPFDWVTFREIFEQMVPDIEAALAWAHEKRTHGDDAD